MERHISSEQVTKNFEIKIKSAQQLLLSLDWSDKNFYSTWLAQTYFFVKHTVGFLGLQVAKYNLATDNNLVSILEHFREEQGHDSLILKDMKSLNVSISEFEEYPETRSFYQPQYFLIDYQGADAHFGYSLFLEGLASKIGPELYEKLSRCHGPNAASFVKVHSLLDQDHFAEGCRELARLSPEVLKCISDNLDQTAALYEIIIKKMKVKCLKQSSHQVA